MEKTFLRPYQPFANCNKQQQKNAFFTPAAISKQTSLWKAEKRQLLPWLFLQTYLICFKCEATSCCPHFLQSVPPGFYLLSGQGCHISTSRSPPGRSSALWCSHFPSNPSPQHVLFFLSNMTERGGRKI